MTQNHQRCTIRVGQITLALAWRCALVVRVLIATCGKLESMKKIKKHINVLNKLIKNEFDIKIGLIQKYNLMMLSFLYLYFLVLW